MKVFLVKWRDRFIVGEAERDVEIYSETFQYYNIRGEGVDYQTGRILNSNDALCFDYSWFDRFPDPFWYAERLV